MGDSMKVNRFPLVTVAILLCASMMLIPSVLVIIVTVPQVFADELYFWTDENGVDHSSATRPSWWKEGDKWTKTGTEVFSQPEDRSVSKAETKGPQSITGQPKGGRRTVQTGPPAFTIPPYVYRVEELEAAMNKAKASREPIAFLYTNENTSCGLATAASLDVIGEFKDGMVIVYVSSANEDNDWARVPRIVKNALISSEAGRFIPKTVVVNPEVTRVISIIPYTKNAEKRKELLRGAKSAF